MVLLDIQIVNLILHNQEGMFMLPKMDRIFTPLHSVI